MCFCSDSFQCLLSNINHTIEKQKCYLHVSKYYSVLYLIYFYLIKYEGFMYLKGRGIDMQERGISGEKGETPVLPLTQNDHSGSGWGSLLGRLMG